jgi:hypothetical protein
MARKKIVHPYLTVSKDIVVDKNMLEERIENLSQGELVIINNEQGVCITTLNNNGLISSFDSSNVIDDKINKVSEQFNELSGMYDAIGSAASAETAAKGYVNTEIGKLSGVYDVLGAAASAETAAKSYANAEIIKLSDVYDVKGSAASAETAAKGYVDTEIAKLSGVYDVLGAAASAETAAKGYTDAEVAKLSDVYASKSVVETLIGEDSGKTARSIATEEVVKIVSGAPEAFDTLREIAEWIGDGSGTTAAQIVTDIENLKTADSAITINLNDMPIIKGDVENSAVLKGGNNRALGEYATAFGGDNGLLPEEIDDSHPVMYSTAEGYASHSEGCAHAIGRFSHAEGGGNVVVEGHPIVPTAEGDYSHAEGTHTWAKGPHSHAEGALTIAELRGAHAEGYKTYAKGGYSHAEGVATFAESGAHAEGGYRDLDNNIISGGTALGISSHAEGQNTLAKVKASHAEGIGTTAGGQASHSEGNGTTAYGHYSHAEGDSTSTVATANSAHAEGKLTVAKGIASHSEGQGTISNNRGEHAEGLWNKSNKSTIHSVGIGTSDTDRKNAHEITTDGKHYILGVGNYSGTTLGGATDVATVISNKADKSDIVTPNWNAQAGEAGYIENKPFGDTLNVSALDLFTTPNSNHKQVEINRVSKIYVKRHVFDDYEDYYQNGIYDVEYGVITPSEGYGPFYITSSCDEDGNEMARYLCITENAYEDASYVEPYYFSCVYNEYYWDFPNPDEQIIQLYDGFIPDTVIKTTPQTLSDSDKNQALSNLGLTDILREIDYNNLKDSITALNTIITENELTISSALNELNKRLQNIEKMLGL